MVVIDDFCCRCRYRLCDVHSGTGHFASDKSQNDSHGEQRRCPNQTIATIEYRLIPNQRIARDLCGIPAVTTSRDSSPVRTRTVGMNTSTRNSPASLAIKMTLSSPVRNVPRGRYCVKVQPRIRTLDREYDVPRSPTVSRSTDSVSLDFDQQTSYSYN